MIMIRRFNLAWGLPGSCLPPPCAPSLQCPWGSVAMVRVGWWPGLVWFGQGVGAGGGAEWLGVPCAFASVCPSLLPGPCSPWPSSASLKQTDAVVNYYI
jgi:hypothetical protein